MWNASGGEAPMEKKLYYKANEVSEILGMDGIKEIFDNINQTTEKNVELMNGEGNVFTCPGNVINNWFDADRKKKSLDIFSPAFTFCCICFLHSFCIVVHDNII